MKEYDYKEASKKVEDYSEAKRKASNDMRLMDAKLKNLTDDLDLGRGYTKFDGIDRDRILAFAKSICEERKQGIQSELAVKLDLI